MDTTTVTPIGACTITDTFDSNGYLKSTCVDCPEVTAIAAVPEQRIVDRRLGWNAGARSVFPRAGDCYTQFTVPAHVIGVVCGLAPVLSVDPRAVPHGFYIYQDSGRELWRVVEGGVGKTAPVVRAPDTDSFRIERRNGVVRYLFNNRQFYVSTARAIDALFVVACLYADNDGIN